MKTLLITLLSILSWNTYAGNLYDNQTTTCRNGGYQLSIEGKRSLFGSRSIMVKKNNQILVEENYEEMHFPYSDRTGSSVMGVTQFRNIISYAYKIKPKSITQSMDYTFRVSTNTIVLQTYSALQPAYGGDTPSIILELPAYNTFVVFELGKQCVVR